MARALHRRLLAMHWPPDPFIELWLWTFDFERVEEASHWRMMFFPGLRSLAIDSFSDASSGTVLFRVRFQGGAPERAAVARWAKQTGLAVAEARGWPEGRMTVFCAILGAFASSAQSSVLARTADLMSARIRLHSQRILESAAVASDDPPEVRSVSQQRRRFAQGTLRPEMGTVESLSALAAIRPLPDGDVGPPPHFDPDDDWSRSVADDDWILSVLEEDDIDIPIYEDESVEIPIDFAAD